MYQIKSVSRFAVVGVCATSIHIVIAATFIENGWLHPGGANSIAFVVATSFSYLLNTRWSFGTEFSLLNAQRFAVTSLIGCALTYCLSTIVDYYGGHYLLGIALVVSTVPVYTYIMHSLWTYKSEP